MSDSVVSEVDYHVESRLAGLIRRRFLWLSGALMLFDLFTIVPILIFFRSHPGRLPQDWRDWYVSSLSLALLIAGWIYAWRALPNRRRLMRLIFVLIFVRVAIDLTDLRLSVGDAKTFLHTALPRESFREYFFAALFIRWSVKEALAIGGSLLIMTMAVAATFIAHPMQASALTLLAPLWFLPGLLICWWWHSRLRKDFRLQYESMQYRKFQSELTSARKLHESLLPRQVDQGPVRLSYVYEPMRQIGGDLIYLHKDNRSDAALSSIIVLDVTGHGIAAALTVNRLVGEIERLFAENPEISPGQVIRALDRYISLTLSRHGIYATAFCAKLDCDSNRLEWCCGGHPPAFIYRADGSLSKLESTAPLLGVDDDSFHNQEPHTRFEPGDVLICYTDGAVEAMNAAREMVGIDGVEAILSQCVAKHLPPHDWPAAVLKQVLAHRGAPAEDDTLIAAIYCPIDYGSRQIQSVG